MLYDPKKQRRGIAFYISNLLGRIFPFMNKPSVLESTIQEIGVSNKPSDLADLANSVENDSSALVEPKSKSDAASLEEKRIRDELWRAQSKLGIIHENFSSLEDQVVSTELISTSVTSSYAEDWAYDRILLDGLQNHMPADSKGSKFNIEFLVGEAWIPFSERGGIKAKNVSKIRYSDDGAGFDNKKLGLFHSDKRADAESIGQFGEGLKMLTAAALNHGLGIDLRSRDWAAKGRFKEFHVDGEDVKQLVYDAEYLDRKVKGSATVVSDVNTRLAQVVLEADRYVLPLRDEDPFLFASPKGGVIVDKGKLFCKGMYIADTYAKDMIFGYDITATLNRDRNMMNKDDVTNHISDVLYELDNVAVMRQILATIEHRASAMEFDALYNRGSNKRDKWKEAFVAEFGEKAVLTSGVRSEADKTARAMGYRVIDPDCSRMEWFLGRFIEKSDKLKTDENVVLLQGESYDPERVVFCNFETSITTAYRAAWEHRRVILDTLGNHEPSDSGGSKVDIELLYVKGRSSDWRPYEKRFSKSDVKGVRISDDGRGFDSESLQLFLSSKAEGESVGQFGEGMKLVANAVLRDSLDGSPDYRVKYRSQNWSAVPFGKDVSVNGISTHQLCFTMANNLDVCEGSQTTFFNPPDRFLWQLDNLGEIHLGYNDELERAFTGTEGTILLRPDKVCLDTVLEGTLFVRDFYVTQDYIKQALFSYNFSDKELVNLERDYIKPEKVQKLIKSIIGECDNGEVVEEILRTGAARPTRTKPESFLYEFQELSFSKGNSNVAEVYKSHFYGIFGEDAVVCTNPDLYSRVVKLGYKPVLFRGNLDATLVNAGVRSDQNVLSGAYFVEEIGYEELTDEQKKNYDLYPYLADVLMTDSIEPKVFTKAFKTSGDETNIQGYYSRDGQVFSNVRMLDNPISFGALYQHEIGHHDTGGVDGDYNFLHFFEMRALLPALRNIYHNTDYPHKEYLGTFLDHVSEANNPFHVMADLEVVGFSNVEMETLVREST